MTEDIRGIADISGMPYEAACQKMLQAGYEWLVKNIKPDLKAITFNNIYGIFDPESPDAKALSKAVTSAEPDCTGAMHHCVMSHLFFINTNGLDKWKEEIAKRK